MEPLTVSQIAKLDNGKKFLHDPNLVCSPLSFQKPFKSTTRKRHLSVRTCTCKSTRCLKKYCVCYANGEACTSDCLCKDCGNTQARAMSEAEKSTVLKCTCKKSKCLKLYCVCFAAGKPCGDECCCAACENSTVQPGGICTPSRHRARTARVKRKRAAPARLDSFLDSFFETDDEDVKELIEL